LPPRKVVAWLLNQCRLLPNSDWEMSEEGRAVDGGARFARTAKAVIVIGGLDPFASVWRVAAPARLVRAGSATLSPGSDSPRRNDWVWEPTDPSARAQVVPAGSEFNNNTSYRAARLDRGSSDGGNSKGNDGSCRRICSSQDNRSIHTAAVWWRRPQLRP